jgi:hypothetical protein
MPFQETLSDRTTLCRRHAFAVAVTALLVAGLAGAPEAPANLEQDVIACRSAIGKAATRLAKDQNKAIAGCHRSRNRGAEPASTDCNDLPGADLRNALPAAESRFSGTVTSSCSGVLPSDGGYDSCPAPCADDVPSITSMTDVASCLVCLGRERAEAVGRQTSGTPDAPLESDAARCSDTIAKETARLTAAIMKIVTRCQAREESAGAETSTWCVSTNFETSDVQDRQLKAQNKIVAACDLSNFAPLDSCAETQFGIAECVSEETSEVAQQLAGDVLASPASATTTTTSTTTSTTSTTTSTTNTTTSTTSTTLPPADPQCPDLAELVLMARDTNIQCTSNAQCTPPRTCNTVAGICQSKSDLDSGWTGHAHNSDLDDGVITLTSLYCPGPSPTCGECLIAGVDPTPGNCRCANDSRAICDQPFAPDADDCGGNTCECFFGVPIPLSSAGTPACIVNRYSEDLQGTANVDLGQSEIEAHLKTRVYLGITTTLPCPVCAGKCSNNPATRCLFNGECGAGTCNFDTPNDGAQDGLCLDGANDNLPCDTAGVNASFPARSGGLAGGGGYSLDCMPASGKNISGAGLTLGVTQTTGTATLTANLPCTGGECHCKQCSASPSTPCNSNVDCSGSGGSCAVSSNFQCNDNSDCTNLNFGNCTGIGRCQLATSVNCSTNADCQNKPGGNCNPSTCSVNGPNGTIPKANGCTSFLCSDMGGGESQCTSGPDDKYCDGLVRANGLGILACGNNADCTTNDPLNGSCTLSQRRSCFLDTITATGAPGTDYPIGAAAFCVGPTSNTSINDVAGLPGPTKVINQGAARTFCAANHGIEYQPGVGGCP